MSDEKKRKLKVEGAVECLEYILDHARSHLYEITHDMVYKYLMQTKKELKKLRRA